MLLAWIHAGVVHTRVERLGVRQRAANAVRHPARNNRTLASWELNPGRVALAAYERCRRKVCHALADATVAMYITGEQERAIDMMRNTDLITMYGRDTMLLISDLRYLATDYGITEEHITDTLIYVANRRFGKSAMSGLDNACGMLTMHGSVTQTNMDASQAGMWLDTTMKYMMLVQDDSEFGFTVNRYARSHSFSILARYPQQSERVCEVLGGGRDARAAQGNRGHGNNARKVYQDELLLCSPAAIEVRMPMLLLGAVMVGISSAPPTNATANKLLTAVYDDGQKVARVFTQRNVCSMCAAAEVRSGIAVKCTHGLPNVNEVTSNRYRERVKKLLAGFGDSAEREIMNMTFSDVPEPVFVAQHIDRNLSHTTAATLLSGTPVAPEVINFYAPVALIGVGCDPGSNGKGSDTAFVVFVLTHRVVVAEPSSGLPPASRHSVFDYHCTVRFFFMGGSSSVPPPPPTCRGTRASMSPAAHVCTSVVASSVPGADSMKMETARCRRGMKTWRAPRDGARRGRAACRAKQKARTTSENQMDTRTRARAHVMASRGVGAMTSIMGAP